MTSRRYVVRKSNSVASLSFRTVQLLLKILNSQFPRAGNEKLSVDLGLLLPLWKLYNKMPDFSDGEPTTIASPLCRALTELFFVAENLALEWDRVREYLWSLMLPEEACDWLVRGVLDVAAVSLVIGYSNKATAAAQAGGAKSDKDVSL